MTDKKPDKYESKAREICLQYWAEDMLRDEGGFIDDIAKALREASECKETPETLHKDSVCKVVSEEKIHALFEYIFTKPAPNKTDVTPWGYFLAGFKAAQGMGAEMKATMELDELWPSIKIITDAAIKYEKNCKDNPSLACSFSDGIRWIKEKVLGNEQGGV